MVQFLVALLLQVAGSIDWSQILDVAMVRTILDSVIDQRIAEAKANGRILMARLWQAAKAVVDSPAWEPILQLILRQNKAKLTPAVASCLVADDDATDYDLQTSVAAAMNQATSEIVA